MMANLRPGHFAMIVEQDAGAGDRAGFVSRPGMDFSDHAGGIEQADFIMHASLMADGGESSAGNARLRAEFALGKHEAVMRKLILGIGLLAVSRYIGRQGPVGWRRLFSLQALMAATAANAAGQMLGRSRNRTSRRASPESV